MQEKPSTLNRGPLCSKVVIRKRRSHKALELTLYRYKALSVIVEYTQIPIIVLIHDRPLLTQALQDTYLQYPSPYSEMLL